MASPTDYSLRIALFSHPRTNSNIFTKLFESQPDVVQRTYSFTPAYMWGPERRVAYKTEEINQLYAAFKSSYESFSTQKCLDDLERVFGEVEANGKIPLMKEHVCFMIQPKIIAKDLAKHSYPDHPFEPLVDHELDIGTTSTSGGGAGIPKNPTFVPDRFMNTLTPIFIIRNPIRMIPSWYTVSQHYGATTRDSEWPFAASYHWCRILYDYYEEHFKANPRKGYPALPLVVDGDELILYTQDIMPHLCDLIHLNSSAIKYTWKASDPYTAWPSATADEASKTPAVKAAIEAFGGTIARSTGVERNPDKYSKPPVLEEERKKWENRWGKDVANDLVKTVREVMEDYDYMMEKRIRPRVEPISAET